MKVKVYSVGSDTFEVDESEAQNFKKDLEDGRMRAGENPVQVAIFGGHPTARKEPPNLFKWLSERIAEANADANKAIDHGLPLAGSRALGRLSAFEETAARLAEDIADLLEGKHD